VPQEEEQEEEEEEEELTYAQLIDKL